PLAEGLPRPFPGPRRPLPGLGLPGDGPSPDHTTGSVRIDSASATLRERAESGQINIKGTRFSTSLGTIQKAGGLYQVTSDSPPVGTFDLELDPPLRLSLLSFDVVSRRLSRYRPETSFQYPAYL